MKSVFVCLVGLLVFFQQCFANHVEGKIEFPEDATYLEKIKTRIELVGVSNDTSKLPLAQTVRVDQEGAFEFWYIPEGTYMLSVSSVAFNLQPFKTKIVIDANREIKAYAVQATKPFESALLEVPHPVRYIPNPTNPKREYLIKRSQGLLESGPIATIINNPLYLGGALLLISMFAMPMLLEKFDPETSRLVKEQRNLKKARSSEAALKELKAGESTATKSEKKEEKIQEIKETNSSSSDAKSTSNSKNRKKKN